MEEDKIESKNKKHSIKLEEIVNNFKKIQAVVDQYS